MQQIDDTSQNTHVTTTLTNYEKYHQLFNSLYVFNSLSYIWVQNQIAKSFNDEGSSFYRLELKFRKRISNN